MKKNPNYRYAQAGLIQAIKATNPLYRVYLKYAFFMDNLPVKFQLGVVIVFYLGLIGLQYLPDGHEVLLPCLNPFTAAALVISLFLVRFIRPLSNFYLCFNKKYGRLLLTKEERMSSHFTAAGFAVFIAGVAPYIFTKEDKFLPLAFFGFAMMAPVGEMFLPSAYKRLLFISAAFLFITGLWGTHLSFVNNDIHNIFNMVFFYNFMVFQFLAKIIFL